MKKVFLTLTMLLFAFVGTMRADVVEIGSLEGAADNSYLPMNSLYDYSFTEQIYTAEEIGTAGTINAFTMWLYGNANLYTMPFDIYMVEVDKDAFASTSDWVTVTAANKVYEGEVTVHNTDAEPYTFNLDTPFQYSGNGNLVIAFLNKTGQWKSGLNGKVFGASGDPVRAIYARRDGTPYDIAALPAATSTTYQRNVISIDMISGGSTPTPPAPILVEITTDPDVLDLGFRPIGYWMEPYTFSFVTTEGNATINQVINGSNAFMTVNLETPATVCDTAGAEATITTGNAAPGRIIEQFAIDYTGNRTLKTFDMMANAYEPVEGDVFELAKEVTVPFTGNAPTGIYKNYNLEGAAPDGVDAIYKFTLDESVLLTAGTNGANGVAKLYTEDFNGQPGPMVDNYYEYNISGEINYPDTDTWFSGHEYTGSNTFFGTSAGGGMYFGYKVPASYLTGYGFCYLTQVESAAYDSYPYNLYVLRGGETPADAELVYYQAMPENPAAMYFFDMDITSPFAIGEDEDLWVIFYSESPYAAYCGKQPVDTENGKIWYTLDGTTWYSNTTYTPVIGLHLQYPNPNRGEVVLNLADMSIQPINNSGTMAEAKGEVTLPVHHNMRARANQISNMYVPAGTYYLAVSSTEENFDVHISAGEVPAPEQAVIITPEDGALGVNNGDIMQWTLGAYTEEMQIILGTQFPPTDILVDWTNDLYQSMALTGLQHNKTYFVQINCRNGAGTTYGEVTGFTTVIDGVEDFAAESENLYPGENAVFTWSANGRTLQGYNLYQDGVLVNEAPITETTYTVEGLEYNMTGYEFALTAVYDEGESAMTDAIVVRMTGNGTVYGTVYEQDGETVVAGATVELRGTDEYGEAQTFTTTTGEDGTYTVEVLAGTNYQAFATKEGYQECASEEVFDIDYEGEVDGIDVILYEYYAPLGQITATLQEEENNVLVEWSWDPAEMIVDFETGDFSQAEFTLPATYPWAITTTNPYEGTYCMKSTCEGIASGSSSIEVTVNVPFEEAKMGFWVRVSSESNYDKFHFYIDGVEQGQALSGQAAYAYKEYAVTAGTHTYKWEYTKDSSVNSNDDCIYVDNITMFRKDVPLPPVQGATTYDFEDQTMMGWTSLDANNDGYGWVSSAEPGQYHNSGVNLAGTGHNESQGYVLSGSYSNSAGIAIQPDNYLVAPTQISAEDGAQIQFYACAQDASYAAEHFGVAVSTTTNTAAAYTTIQEWTMTAKGTQGRTAEAERDIRGLRQGSWYLYTVDLSAYAGQDIWVAIRHFNCYDMFILNVDDIVLADGSAKGAVVDHTRSLQNYKLYRRNNNLEEPVAELLNGNIGADVTEYIDNSWNNLPFGIYQWGIQACYAGNRGDRGELTVCDGTETNSYIPVYGLWMDDYTRGEMIYPAEMLAGMNGGQISSLKYYISTPASGPWTGDVFNVYLMEVAGTTLDSYYTSTGATIVYTGSLDGQGTEMTINFTTPYTYNGGNLLVGIEEIECSTYKSCYFYGITATGASASGYNSSSVANATFNQRNFLPKTTFTYAGGGSGGGTTAGDGLSEILWSNEIEKDMYSDVTVNVTLNNGQTPEGVTVAMGNNTLTTDETGTVVFEALPKGEYELVVSKAEFLDYNETVTIDDNTEEFNITLIENVGPVQDLYVSPTGWAMWTGAVPSGPVNPVNPPTVGNWYYYDNGENEDAIGLTSGGSFYWGIMFPAGTYEGNSLTKIAYFDYTAHSGSVIIYQGGSNAPQTQLYTQSYSVTGSETYVEIEMDEAVSIDNTQNLWVVMHNNDGQYVAAIDAGPGVNYGSCLSMDGSSWYTMVNQAAASLDGNWNLRAYLETGSGRGAYISPVAEVFTPSQTETSGTFVAAGVAKGRKADRAALSYKVMIDGQYEGETPFAYFQHDVEGFEAGSEHTTSVAAIYATGMGAWTDYTWTYTPCENYTGASDVTAEQLGSTVKIDWTMPEGGNPTPPPTPPTGGWTEDFESGMPTGWATIDADGDGSNWTLGSTAMGSGYGHNGSSDLILSKSYDNSLGALNPNNYLVTPQVTPSAGSTFSFYACAQDNAWAAEHFGVAISTGSQTNASDFTMLQEWTMTAKDGGIAAPGRGGDLRTQGNWYEYSVDLSAYAGQNVYLAIRHFNCTDYFYLDVDDVTFTTSAKGNRDMWDYVASFSCSSAGQQAVCTDGNYIYTASWQTTPTGGHTFYKYQMDGTFVEGFEIAGATGIRDITTDGEYFYGTSGGAQIFIMDFTNQTLVGTINCSGLTSRHISYDPVRDGFWSGNWSTLALYSRTGAQIQAGTAPSSAYGSAYYQDADGAEHLFLFCQPNSDAKVYDYNIATNTISSSPVFDFASTPGFNAAIAGGCFIGDYNGSTCWFGNAQQDPNLVGIYELAAGTGPTPPPTPPTGDILGAYVFRNGELISGITPITTGTFTDETPEAGDYCVRVVYSDYSMSCPECVDVDYTCVPVNNLTAEYTWNNEGEYGVTLAWDCAQADYVWTYDIYFSDTIVTQTTDMSYFVDMTYNPGEYTFGVIANYGFCESEIVYVDVVVTSVDDIMNNVMLYPNPTNSNVTIEAAGMNHITVVNAVGQVVYDADVDADMLQLNLGQYPAGIYMVRINTENGMGVKRVTVVK